jgi:hypothetical protein
LAVGVDGGGINRDFTGEIKYHGYCTAGKGLCLGVDVGAFLLRVWNADCITDHLGLVLQVRREHAFLGSEQVSGISATYIV